MMRSTEKEIWLQQHYELEKYWADRIRNSPKGSSERSLAYKVGYDEVIELMSTYREDYQPANRGRRQLKTCLNVVNNRHNIKLLDVGCGNGLLLKEAASFGWEIYGVDVSEFAVKQARHQLQLLGIKGNRVIAGTIDDVNEKDFDIVYNDQVLEHIHPDSVNEFITSCVKRLKPGGFLITTTPEASLGPHDITRYFEKTGSPAKGFHLHEYTFHELVYIMEKHDLEPFTFLLHPSIPVNRLSNGKIIKLKYFLERILKSFSYHFTPHYSQRRYMAKMAHFLGFGIIVGKKK